MENSLERWVGVTLHYVNAWRDNESKTWVDEHFHLLNSVAIPRHHGRPSKKACNGRRLPWTTIWNETVFRSFQDGYVRELNIGVLRRFKTAAAKQMYRFLDKRLYKTDRLTFGLRAFACERVGFSRAYDNSQLKRKLDRAILELEQVEFLEPLPKEQLYRRVRRGEWKVTFILSNKWTQKKRARSECTPLEAVLMDRGVTRRVAAKLVRGGSHEAIRQCVREYDEHLKSGGVANLENPPGLLVKKIRERLASSNVGCRQKYSANKGDSTAPMRTASTLETAESEAAESHKQLEAIREYLHKLSPGQRESLDARAMKGADRLQRAGYRRAQAAGNSRLLDDYRTVVVESYVRRLLFGK